MYSKVYLNNSIVILKRFISQYGIDSSLKSSNFGATNHFPGRMAVNGCQPARGDKELIGNTPPLFTFASLGARRRINN